MRRRRTEVRLAHLNSFFFVSYLPLQISQTSSGTPDSRTRASILPSNLLYYLLTSSTSELRKGLSQGIHSFLTAEHLVGVYFRLCFFSAPSISHPFQVMTHSPKSVHEHNVPRSFGQRQYRRQRGRLDAKIQPRFVSIGKATPIRRAKPTSPHGTWSNKGIVG